MPREATSTGVMQRFGEAFDHNGEGAPSERKALGWLKSRATHVRHRGFFGGALVRLHRLDPQRRKSSIISRPLEAGFSCSRWTIFSMTTSRPPWPSTVSWPLNPRALPGAVCDFQAPGIPEHPGTPPAPIFLSETAGLAACGETGMVASLSAPVVAIRSWPIVPIRPRKASGIRFFSGA